MDAGLPVTYTLNINSATPSECESHKRKTEINGLATIDEQTRMTNLAWIDIATVLTEYQIDFTGIDTTNTDDPTQPIYEGSHVLSLFRRDFWTSSV